MYYKVYNADSESEQGGAFEDKEVAEAVCDHLNEEYKSKYKLVEEEFATGAEILRGNTILQLERLNELEV